MSHLFLSRLLAIAAVPLILLGLRYRSAMSTSWRSAWLALISAVLLGESALLVNEMRHNVAFVPEFDFLGFWLNAHVAAGHHNFYDPVQAQTLAQGMSIGSEFRREILDVGFWYPPPSIFVFLPLALFSNIHVAYAVWYALQVVALFMSAFLLARQFLNELNRFQGTAVVAALILLLPATAGTITFGQTTFFALMFTTLFWVNRGRGRGGFWLVLAALTKPLLGALAIALLCQRKWRPVVGLILSSLAISILTAVFFGPKTFFTYFQARPDARIPAWVYSEQTNQSLLGMLLRITHSSPTEHLPRLPLVVFATVALTMTIATVWLCLRDIEVDTDIALGLTLSLGLLVYPVSQSFYAVLLIVPVLIIWKRSESDGETQPFTIAGIAVGYVLMALGYAELSYVLSWLIFALIAAPANIRKPTKYLSSYVIRNLAGLAKAGQSVRSSALGLAILFSALVFIVAGHDIAFPKKSRTASAGTDFRAFYCSGVAANKKASPYLLEPLRSCEHRVQPAPGWADELVIPSPLPGYDIALFAVLAHAPYAIAKAAWLAVSLGCLFLAAWFLATLTRLPALMILLGLSLIDGYVPLGYGQLPPVVVAALCAAAYFTERRRYAAAAAAAAVSLLEPHLGLPACLAMFIWIPKTRVALLAAGAFLALTSGLATGLAGNVAYFTRFLPEQAAAEIVAIDQYGLSHELHVAGLTDRTALSAGLVSYVIMMVIGVFLARRAATALSSDSLIVLLPVAAALFGGSFVHDIQFAAALPCAFMLAARAKVWQKGAWLALMLLSFPWFSFGDSGRISTIILGVIALATWIWFSNFTEPEPGSQRRIAVATCAVLLFGVVLFGFSHLPESVAPKPAAIILPAQVLVANASAASNWAAYLRANPASSTLSPRKELEKVPTWAAIVLLLSVAWRQKRQRIGSPVQRTASSLDVPAEAFATFTFESSHGR